MTNEQLVLNYLDKKWTGKSPLHFKEFERSAFGSLIDWNNYKNRIDNCMRVLNDENSSVKDRVSAIIDHRGQTYDNRNRYQCHANARRSVVDIWRIYKYYCGDIDIFSIMRVLYEITITTKLSTYRCPNVRKRVFWNDTFSLNGYKDLDVEAETGVPLTEWKNIGENHG